MFVYLGRILKDLQRKPKTRKPKTDHRLKINAISKNPQNLNRRNIIP